MLLLTIEMHLNMPQADNINNPDLPKPDILKAREYAIEALKINRPNFDLEKIGEYFLTQGEFAIISTLATTYGYANDLATEVDILAKLKVNYEKNHKIVIADLAITDFYSMLLTNIGINYKLLERWEECLQQAISNMDFYIKSNDIRLYCRAIYQRAYSLMKLGKTAEGKEYYKKFFMLAHVLDGEFAINFAVVKKEYEEVFGGQVDIAVAW